MMVALEAFEVDQDGARISFKRGDSVPSAVVKNFALVKKGLVKGKKSED